MARLEYVSLLAELYLTRLREFYRQPARIFWVYGFPTVLAIGLGLAFRSRPAGEHPGRPGRDAASRRDREGAPRLRRARPAARGGPACSSRSARPRRRTARLRTGKTPLVDRARGVAGLVYRYDPTRPEAVAAQAAVDDILQRGGGRQTRSRPRISKVTEPGSRYIDFLIPGLIGLNTMGGGLWGIGFLLVNFRIAKLLKCFMATPMPRRDFLLALLGARLTFLIPDMAVLLLLGVLVFGMPIRGSLLAGDPRSTWSAPWRSPGSACWIASRAQTTETVSGLMNLVMLPMWLFSGVFFSSERFPDAVQPFIQALPLTQLISALRQVILEGAGWLDVMPAPWRSSPPGRSSPSSWRLRIFRWT